MSHNVPGSWQWVPDVAAEAAPPSQPAEAAASPHVCGEACQPFDMVDAYKPIGPYKVNGLAAESVVEFLCDVADHDFHELLSLVSFRRYLRFGSVIVVLDKADL